VQLDSSDLEIGAERMVRIDLPGGAIVRVPGGATVAEQRGLIAAIVQATSTEVDDGVNDGKVHCGRSHTDDPHHRGSASLER
jgi:hypothetical protein